MKMRAIVTNNDIMTMKQAAKNCPLKEDFGLPEAIQIQSPIVHSTYLVVRPVKILQLYVLFPVSEV